MTIKSLFFLPFISTVIFAQTTVTFAVIGDYGADNANEDSVSVMIDSWNVDFIVTVGDNSYGNRPIDDNIGKYYANYIGSYSGGYGAGAAVNKFFPVPGNHDYGDGGGIAAYMNYFTLPGINIPSTGTSGSEEYYDFYAGPGDFLHFFMITSGTAPQVENTAWVQTQMQASTSTWQLVLLHHAPYSSGSDHGSQPAVQLDYEDWGADVVLAGHDHIYERIHKDDNNDGVTVPYFVSGNGGRSVDVMGSPVSGSQFRLGSGDGNVFGAMKVTATPESMQFEEYTIETAGGTPVAAAGGALRDSYAIGSTPPPPPPPPPITQAGIEEVMRRAADYRLAQGGFGSAWRDGAFYSGIMALYRTTGDQVYLDNAMSWANSQNWLPGGGATYTHGDNQAVNQVYLELYLEDPVNSNIQNVIVNYDGLITTGTGGTCPIGREEWPWADALFMSPTGSSRLSFMLNDPAYRDCMHSMWWDHHAFLFNSQWGMYHNRESRRNVIEPNGLPEMWSRGNGWVMAATARVLEFLPSDFPERFRYEDLLTTMAVSISAVQDPNDGLWRTSLLDPNHFPQPEMSGSGFFTFAIAWGINNGILDRQAYGSVVENAWLGMVSHVDVNGYMHNVQPGGNHPEAPLVNPDNATTKFGVGAFLLAGSEMYEYISGGVADVNGETAPAKFVLAQNYPNPFNPTTTIEYDLASEGPVKLVVYDLLGREVSKIVDEVQAAGKHNVTFDASHLVSSVYFYKLESGDFVSLKKMILVK